MLAKPDLINKPGANHLLMRFLSIPEGILYLEEHGWVDQMVQEWKDNDRTTAYAEIVDTKWNVSWADSAGLRTGNALFTRYYFLPYAEFIDCSTDAKSWTFLFADEYQRDGTR